MLLGLVENFIMSWALSAEGMRLVSISVVMSIIALFINIAHDVFHIRKNLTNILRIIGYIFCILGIFALVLMLKLERPTTLIILHFIMSALLFSNQLGGKVQQNIMKNEKNDEKLKSE